MFTVGKLNIGVPRVFKTREGLERALRRAGAHRITWGEPGDSAVYVEWKEGVVDYAIDDKGNIDQQLAWDMET